jgi:hypothetical protein
MKLFELESGVFINLEEVAKVEWIPSVSTVGGHGRVELTNGQNVTVTKIQFDKLTEAYLSNTKAYLSH